MILVFGKTGQVGNELKNRNNIKSLSRKQADLLDPQACSDAILFTKPRAVINAAAYTRVDEAEVEEHLARRINGEAPARMAEACSKLRIPFVHLSTDYVFSGDGTAPWHASDKPDPRNAYGRSKLQGERAIEASGCVHAILRTSWVFSKHGNNFFSTMLRISKTRENIGIVNDQVGGPTSAHDIAQTCILLAQQLINKPEKSGIYHYAGQPDVSWCQFANSIFEQIGGYTVATPILTSEYLTPAQRPLNSRLNCSTTEDVFGFSRPFWRDGLQMILTELGLTHDKT